MTPTVRAGSLELAYHELGDGDPVLLISGTGESGLTWMPLMELLAPRWRCVAYDQRDTGGSTYAEGGYAPADLARDAAHVVEQLELGACHVVGYSLGGAVAQELAIARPDLVRSLVLLSTWARSDDWFRAQMRSWRSIRRAHWDDDEAFLSALDAWLYSPATFADPDRVAEIDALPDRLGETPQRPEGWIRQTMADEQHDTLARLGDVGAPALIIVGADDICTPPRFSHELLAALQDARLVEVADAGHAALFEHLDVVAEAIAGFLASVAGRG